MQFEEARRCKITCLDVLLGVREYFLPGKKETSRLVMTINTSIIKCDRLLLSVHCLHYTLLPSLSLSYWIACGSSEHGKQSIKHLQIKLCALIFLNIEK